MENIPLKVGHQAPEFALMNQDKKVIKLADFKDQKNLVLIFYPMDFSPVCTDEHSCFGPAMGDIQKEPDTLVFGVSCDSPFCHAAYRKKYNIPYDLLSDPTRRMAKAYGMWAGEEPYNCTKRGTVVIDKTGKVVFYSEVPMKEQRKPEAIAAAAGTLR